MSDPRTDIGADAPTIDVRVLRYGRVIHEELCESEEEAALVLDGWSDMEGVEFDVRDLTQRGPGKPSEEEPVGWSEEGYPEDIELEEAAHDRLRAES